MSKAVLITGAGARVGAHFAKGLAAQGWHVAIHYNRSHEKAEKLVAEIKSAGGQAASVKANLSVPQDTGTLVARAAKAIGQPLTALINNASTFTPDTAETFTRATYDYHMEVNLRAPLLLTQQLAAQMPDGEHGSVINMIDQRVLKPNPTFFSYSIAKAALYWATKTQAQSYAPHIRVNGIGPGPSLQSVHQDGDEFQREADNTLLRQTSSPDALLDGVLYLLSASSVTGQMLAIDSGQHLTWQTPDLMVRHGDD